MSSSVERDDEHHEVIMKDDKIKDSSQPPKKKFRSIEEDLTVIVGSGDKEQTFKCYKVLLCLESVYFDTMLSCSMQEKERSTIRFPYKDPEEWKLWYTFIDPDTKKGSKITNDNIRILLPWFHEFQMQSFVDECDEFLSKHFPEEDPNILWNRQNLDDLFDLLWTANVFCLSKTMSEMAKKVKKIVSYRVKERLTYEDIEKICECLKNAYFTQEIDDLWTFVKDFLPENYKDKNKISIENEMFTHLVFANIQKRAAEEKIRSFAKEVLDLPEQLYYILPNKKTRGSAYAVDDMAQLTLQRLIYDIMGDDELVEIPTEWKDYDYEQQFSI